MNLLHPTQKKMSLLISLLFLVTACSKDADLLSDYVIAKDADLQSIALLVDDQFFIGNDQTSIVMDVLNNDNFGSDVQVSIVETSTPKNGEVIINADNTLTYSPHRVINTDEASTPEETTETPAEDSFTYTTEVTTPDNDVSRQEATVSINSIEMGELLAFPGAEGFGRYAVGGRDGQVIHVTNLNDSGPGSFRDAVERKGARTVVFDVGGEIQLLSDIKLRTEHENLTIAGQTAPFPGISLRNYGLDIYASNVIIRYITIRLGGYQINNGGIESDCLRIIHWGETPEPIENIIIDHCSFSWATDENISIRSNSENSDIKNVTFSNLIVGEPSSESSYNMLVGTRVFNISIFNNFFSTARERSPLIGYGDNGESVELINNVIYGFESGSISTYGSNVDIIGNIFKGLKNNNPDFEVVGAGDNGSSNTINEGSLFAKDNFKLNAPNKGLYNMNAQTRINNTSNRYFSNSLINNWGQNIAEIENSVIGSAIGNSIYRDAVDSRLLNNYLNDSGFFFEGLNPNVLPGGWPSKLRSTHPTNYDTDNDGMADSWEISNFGTLEKLHNGDENGNGYTNLEEYLYWITKQ